MFSSFRWMEFNMLYLFIIYLFLCSLIWVTEWNRPFRILLIETYFSSIQTKLDVLNKLSEGKSLATFVKVRISIITDRNEKQQHNPICLKDGLRKWIRKKENTMNGQYHIRRCNVYIVYKMELIWAYIWSMDLQESLRI